MIRYTGSERYRQFNPVKRAQCFVTTRTRIRILVPTVMKRMCKCRYPMSKHKNIHLGYSLPVKYLIITSHHRQLLVFLNVQCGVKIKAMQSRKVSFHSSQNTEYCLHHALRFFVFALLASTKFYEHEFHRILTTWVKDFPSTITKMPHDYPNITLDNVSVPFNRLLLL